ncbi:hypothetical protein BLS_005151 [Venturia inaequalis]|uniref:R3H domain-containing protein n=1 Tax=Venturia inaequalis TaxID=5025 RepID=A0A8H3Z838_VENIN|nr:hypothetical protein BLS_005151 [Venturia inaequalis]RDI79502.1 hypothetical protein Vi05172_g10348 [Venturia inaequalis]
METAQLSAQRWSPSYAAVGVLPPGRCAIKDTKSHPNKQNTSVCGLADGYLNARSILARSYATKDNVVAVGKPSLTRSAATVVGLFSNHHYPAAPDHRHVDLPASVPGIAVTLKSPTTVTKTRIKQEVKCGGTKLAEGNAVKSLKCDDTCALLERNRKLVLALNIDQDTHKDDHIPYQAETLNMYLKTPAWAQTQEKQLRLFAADPDQKRLRFKPMKNNERAFIHALAEDFGFDSESMDPEPHRHVAIFKTPRFVMAPMKTLAECVRIRQIQRTMSTGVSAITTESKAKAKASNLVGDPLNALLLTDARFGLTVEELRTAINPSLAVSGTGLQFDISFLPSEEIVLVPLQQQVSSERALETTLSNLKPGFVKALTSPNFLGRLQLCRVDDSLNIERRESDSASSGWSQVAAKAAAPKRDVPHNGLFSGPRNKNNFAIFSTAASKKKAVSEETMVQTGSSKTKKTQRQESVDEDWMAAEEREEEKERLVSGENTARNSGDEGEVDETTV